MIILDICLSDIPKEEIYTAKNGKKYIKFVVGNKKEKDEWGNDLYVKVSVPKERREEPPVFVGKGKTYESKGDGRGPKMDLSGKIDPDDLPW